jgi:hypothetical protein
MGSLRDAATGLSGNFDTQFDDLSRRYKDSTSKAISRVPRRMEGLTPNVRPTINIYFAQRSLGQSYLAAQHIELVSKQKTVGTGWEITIGTVNTERVLDGGPASRNSSRGRKRSLPQVRRPIVRSGPTSAKRTFIFCKANSWNGCAASSTKQLHNRRDVATRSAAPFTLPWSMIEARAGQCRHKFPDASR